MFKHQKHAFFQSLTSVNKNDLLPQVDDTLLFWKQLWENPCQHDPSLLTHVKPKIHPCESMTPPVITHDLFLYATSRIKNWKAPGPDGLHGFWIKQFNSLHGKLCGYLNDILSGRASVDPWLLEGRTTLIIKNHKRGAVPSNFRPITCLSTLWKLFSFIISELIYTHLDANSLLPSEQKGCCKNSRGAKDHLLVDKLVMDIAKDKHKNLHMAWIDYSKAYDSVPHSWILECLKLYRVDSHMYDLLTNVMKCWKIKLYCSDKFYGDISILRGIYQGDSLSPLLFVMAVYYPQFYWKGISYSQGWYNFEPPTIFR